MITHFIKRKWYNMDHFMYDVKFYLSFISKFWLNKLYLSYWKLYANIWKKITLLNYDYNLRYNILNFLSFDVVLRQNYVFTVFSFTCVGRFLFLLCINIHILFTEKEKEWFPSCNRVYYLRVILSIKGKWKWNQLRQIN